MLIAESPPACFGETGDLTARSRARAPVAGETRFAEHTARTTGQSATIAQTGRVRGCGQRLSLARASACASSPALLSAMMDSRAARFLAYLATRSRRFVSRLIVASFAIFVLAVLLSAEGKRNAASRAFCFVIGLRGGRERDVHAAQRVNLVVPRSRENDLLFHTEIEVAATVKPRGEMPRKSRTRGSATLTKRSRNSYICLLRSVTIVPTG